MMEYGVYQFSKKELAENSVLFLLLTGGMAYLFYRSILVFAVTLALFPVFLKKRKEGYIRKRRLELEGQFLDGIRIVATELTAGYSAETAFEDACAELENIYDKDDMILKEFRYISSQLGMNRNLEELLEDLGERSGSEDIGGFAELFAVCKRTGGNLLSIIRNTAWNISQKEETQRDIMTALAAKKMELNIMSLVPALILLYVQTISPGFLDGMYHNAAGISVMTLCLILYGTAYFWGRRIVDIRI